MSALSILIIEDDSTLMRGLKDNFLAQGYDVRAARDGQEGLNAILKSPPDLVLLDLMLPKINGYEICRLVRAQQVDVPIIMLTAKGQEEDIVRGLELGADDYVTKPHGHHPARQDRARSRAAEIHPHHPGYWIPI